MLLFWSSTIGDHAPGSADATSGTDKPKATPNTAAQRVERAGVVGVAGVCHGSGV